MEHPDDAASSSRAGEGEVAEKPDEIVSIVVTDSDDIPAGVLEKWDSEVWIYAPTEDLEQLN